MAVVQITAKELEIGNVISSANESYVIKEIEVDGSNLVISFWGAFVTMEIDPNAQLLVQLTDPPLTAYEEFIVHPKESQKESPRKSPKSKKGGWNSDGSLYTTPTGIPYTEEEIMWAAYDGADFSPGNSYPR